MDFKSIKSFSSGSSGARHLPLRTVDRLLLVLTGAGALTVTGLPTVVRLVSRLYVYSELLAFLLVPSILILTVLFGFALRRVSGH